MQLKPCDGLRGHQLGGCQASSEGIHRGCIDNMGWQCIPQPDGCWKVAVLICHYPDCGDNELLIVASGVSFFGDEVWMLWNLHQAVNDLITNDDSCPCPSLFQTLPAQMLHHRSDTTGPVVVFHHRSCCPPLLCLNL